MESHFYPDKVQTGAITVSGIHTKLSEASSKISSASNIDGRIKSRLSFDFAGTASEINNYVNDAKQITQNINNVLLEYYKITGQTTEMSSLLGLNLGGFDVFGALNSFFSNPLQAIGDAASVLGDFWQGVVGNATDFFANTGAAIMNGFNCLASVASNAWNATTNAISRGISAIQSAGQAVIDTGAKVVDNIVTFISPATNAIGDFAMTAWNDYIVPTASSIGMGICGLGNGILNVAEDIVDFGADIAGCIASIPAGIVDGVSYLATGEGAGALDAVWGGIQDFVQTEWVNNSFEWIFTETDFGKAMNENAVDWMKYGSTGYNVAEGTGYIGGLVALTVLTAGVGGAAGGAGAAAGSAGRAALGTSLKAATKTGTALSFMTGTGRGTEESWNNGANTLEGLLYGGASGAFDALQWYAGGKIAGLGAKALVADAGLGFIDVPTRSLLQGIYSDESYANRFESNGGWNATLFTTGLAGIFSGAGEVSVAKKLWNAETIPNMSNKLGAVSTSKTSVLKDVMTKLGNLKSQMSPLQILEEYSKKRNSKVLDVNTKALLDNYSTNDLNKLMALAEYNSAGTSKKPFEFYSSLMDRDTYNGFAPNQGVIRELNRSDLLSGDAKEFRYLKSKLKKQGFSGVNATKTLKMIDTTGACSYASAMDIIINKFKDMPHVYEQIFGYPLIKDGKLNDAELLLDLFVHANQKTVKNPEGIFKGNRLLEKSDETQVYLANKNTGINTDVINDFLSSKLDGLQCNSSFIVLPQVFDKYNEIHYVLSKIKNGDNYNGITGEKLTDRLAQLQQEVQNVDLDKANQQLRNRIDTKLEQGKSIEIQIYKPLENRDNSNYEDVVLTSFNPTKYANVSTKTWNEGGGHIMPVVGTNERGIIVGTWSRPYVLEYSDLLHSDFKITESEIVFAQTGEQDFIENIITQGGGQ